MSNNPVTYDLYFNEDNLYQLHLNNIQKKLYRENE